MSETSFTWESTQNLRQRGCVNKANNSICEPQNLQLGLEGSSHEDSLPLPNVCRSITFWAIDHFLKALILEMCETTDQGKNVFEHYNPPNTQWRIWPDRAMTHLLLVVMISQWWFHATVRWWRFPLHPRSLAIVAPKAWITNCTCKAAEIKAPTWTKK